MPCMYMKEKKKKMMQEELFMPKEPMVKGIGGMGMKYKKKKGMKY